MVWDDELTSARTLLLDILIPMSREGLEKIHINPEDIEKYLSVIEKRAAGHLTGSRWIVKSYRTFRKKYGREEATVALTAIMNKMRKTGEPIHNWNNAALKDLESVEIRYDVVSNVMSTDLITVTENDLAELVLKIMEWRNIRHLPVEGPDGKLKGIITKKRLINYLSDNNNDPFSVASDVMNDNPVTISPNDDLKYAMLLMLDQKISCLPVVEENRLVGILTERDTNEVWKKIKKADGSGNKTE